MASRVVPLTYRRALLWGIGLLLLLGLATKFYPGPGHTLLNNAVGGTIYVMFWITLAARVWPRAAAATLAVGVLVATGLVELLQLWQPSSLQAIRATLPGRLLLGTTFSWADFPFYLLGAGLGWLGLRWLQRRSQRQSW